MISLPFDPWTSYGILIISETFIFLMMLLDLRLLKPRKVRITLWFAPLLSAYVVASIVYLTYDTLGTITVESLAVAYGSFVIGALVGLLIGYVMGRAVKVGPQPDGYIWFEGGKGLVAVLWVLLLPQAIVEAIVIIPSVYSQGTIASLITGNPLLSYLSSITGILVVVGAFFSFEWRTRVSEKAAAFPPHKSPGHK